MTGIHDVQEAIRGLPTVMGIENELRLVGMIMNLQEEDVYSNIGEFRDVIDALVTSRHDTYYELNSENIKYFHKFSDWLIHISNKLEGGIKEEIVDAARIMKIHPEF